MAWREQGGKGEKASSPAFMPPITTLPAISPNSLAPQESLGLR